MSDPRSPAPAASTERGRDLRELNRRLKELVASLRAEKDRLAEPRAPRAPLAPAPSPAPGPETADLGERRLSTELALLREAVAHAQDERDRLRARVAELEAENRRMSDDHVAARERSSELTRRYLALERLHGGASRADTLAAIQEIVVDLVGSEELAVFERRGGVALALVHAFGVAPRTLEGLSLGEGAIARAAASGRPWVAGRDGPPAAGEEDLTAAIPLRAGSDVHGVLAIFGLLGHGPILGEREDAVLDLLSTHAGLALRLRDPRGAAAG